MFGLMYLNTYQLDHVSFSETRAYMALVMGATMAVVMLGFMLKMYPDRRLNISIFAGSAAAFTVALWLVRSQATVADGIIEAQRREIAEMKALSADLEGK
jgi:multisubunit Na+/H+ antiporter MnhE subunit